MKLYKLTDEHDRTRDTCQWGEGVTHTADGEGGLCSRHWIHAYEHPLLAVLHNPIHANLGSATIHMWECETTDEHPLREGYLKLGVRSLTTVRRIEMPKVTTEQRVRYGILCALEVYSEAGFVRWAHAWLDGSDCSFASAYAVAKTVANAAYTAKRVTDTASNVAKILVTAKYAAYAASYAVNAAVIYASNATDAAKSAADAADMSYDAASTGINFIAIAQRAMER